MQVALFSLLAASRLAIVYANTGSSSVKCPTFPTIGSKYGSGGGTLLNNAFKNIEYPIQALPKCASQCTGHDVIKTYTGSLASKLSGIDGHFLQVMTSDEKPGYLIGNKVIRALYARETKKDPLLVKIREYTFHNDGGYYRRSRFFQYSCPAAFTEITTAETAANSKASYGIKLLSVFSNSSKDKQYRFDPTSANSEKMKKSWTMKASGSKPWLGSVTESKNTRKYYTASNGTVVSMQSTGLSELGPLSIEYFFSTYPVLWKAGPSSLSLQEDLMESVITVDTSKIKPALKADSTLQLRYEVYTGSAKLSWDDTTKVLTVTPVDATTQAGLPSLQEFYKFEAFVDCIGDAGTSRLKIKLKADIAKGKTWNGFVAITADVQGGDKCKQIVWDPTNGELKLDSAPTAKPTTAAPTITSMGPGGKTAAPTTATTTIAATTTAAPGGSPTKFTGSITMSATGLNQSTMETAVKAAIATHFDVAAGTVTLIVTKSRRLNAAPRNLADTWTVGYEFTAPAAKVAAVETKAAALTSTAGKAALRNVVGQKLIAAGAPQSAVDSLKVTAATATKESSAGPNVAAASSAVGATSLLVGLAAIQTMFQGL